MVPGFLRVIFALRERWESQGFRRRVRGRCIKLAKRKQKRWSVRSIWVSEVAVEAELINSKY